jgi:hypothetical protein
MVNNELEKALETFSKFKSLALETESRGGMKNLPYVDQEVQSVKNAMSNLEAPFKISKSIKAVITMIFFQFNQSTINITSCLST